MRSALTWAAGVLVAALLYGCSNLPQVATMPGSPSAASARERVAVPHFYPFSDLTPGNVLRMQLAGTYPTRQPHRAFVASYERSLIRRDVTPIRHPGKIGVWTVPPFSGELLGLTTNAKKTVLTVDVKGCTYPESVRVDSEQNVWTSCEHANRTDGAALQEYDSSGTLVAQYTSACPSNVPSGSCSLGWFSHFLDGATGGNLACGAADEFEYEHGIVYTYGTGFICWPLGDSSAGSVLIPIWSCNGHAGIGQDRSCSGNKCKPVCQVWEADMDSSGNIYFTYEGGSSSSSCGGGIGEVLHPGKASQSIEIIGSPCALAFPGSAYVSNHSTVLDALDQDRRLIYEYHLPLSSSSTPFKTLGPTEAKDGVGDPDGMGFNQSDTKVIIGDYYGWFDIGIVKQNKWSMLTSTDFGPAAYTPSDK